jgi:signal transduction histidine kinase/ligand-binding sensor domain-containing protein
MRPPPKKGAEPTRPKRGLKSSVVKCTESTGSRDNGPVNKSIPPWCSRDPWQSQIFRLLACCLIACINCFSLDPAKTIEQYAHTAWTRQEAHGPSGVLSLVQTSEGALLIGTELGLLRFDGVQFIPWHPPGFELPNKFIGALKSAHDGSLWIGTREGLSHWSENEIKHYAIDGGPAVDAILQDRKGTLWAASIGFQSGKLCRVEGQTTHCFGTDDGLPGSGVTSIFQDREGTIWIGGVGGLSLWNKDRLTVVGRPNRFRFVESIAQEPDGGIIVTTAERNRIWRVAGGKIAPQPINAGISIYPNVLLVDRDGGVWIGTLGQGIVHVNKKRIDRFTHIDGLSSDIVRCLFEDREGNVWVGTDGGLDRFREFSVTTFTKREGLAGSIAGCVYASKFGGIWIGTDGGLSLIRSGEIRNFDRRDGLPNNSISGIFEEEGGRLWVDSESGLTYRENGRFQQPQFKLGNKMREITAAIEDHDHTVWIGAQSQGLVHLRGERMIGVVPWSYFRGKPALAIETDIHGDGLWLGFEDGGVAHFRVRNSPRWYGTSDGLAPGEIVGLHFWKDGTLLIASRSGISFLKSGAIRTFGSANGLPCDQIQAIVADEDDAGALWLNTACGLLSVAQRDLQLWLLDPRHKVGFETFDGSDGMTSHGAIVGYFRPAAKSNDGRLWFAVLNGVAVIDPKHLPHNAIPPPVKIDQTIADQVVHPFGSFLRLPPLTRDIEIDYTAFSFVNPEKVQFRYKLENYDSDWQESGPRRQAIYTNLPPKSYRFRVSASNNDGIWNSTGATLDFSIQPAFYQTKTFLFICFLATSFLLWGLYRLRVRQVAARLRLGFEERLAERSRIATELHDNLLQNVSGLALQLDGLSKTVAAPASAKDRLRELRAQAENWLREAREAVWDLKMPFLEGGNFGEKLRKSIEQIIGSHGIQLDLSIIGQQKPLAPKLEEQLIRILREAARNAVAHSQAKEIALRVSYTDSNVFRIQMQDNGCGFDPREASLKLGHWGLEIMRERARQIGADLEVSSTPGYGTQLNLLIRLPPGK